MVWFTKVLLPGGIPMSHSSSAGPQKLRHWLREVTTFCKRHFGEEMLPPRHIVGVFRTCVSFPSPRSLCDLALLSQPGEGTVSDLGQCTPGDCSDWGMVPLVSLKESFGSTIHFCCHLLKGCHRAAFVVVHIRLG